MSVASTSSTSTGSAPARSSASVGRGAGAATPVTRPLTSAQASSATAIETYQRMFLRRSELVILV